MCGARSVVCFSYMRALILISAILCGFALPATHSQLCTGDGLLSHSLGGEAGLIGSGAAGRER